MTIPASAQNKPIVGPSQGMQFTDERGYLTNPGRIALQQLRNYITNMSRTMPCDATGTNIITLTLLAVQPQVNQYVSYETYGFVAANTSTGLVTANVVTALGALPTLNVYKTNGSAQATTGDVVQGLHYFATYVDSLNSNLGGFVLR